MWYKYLILVMAIILIVVGIVSGEANVVLSKAVRVCLECIGVG